EALVAPVHHDARRLVDDQKLRVAPQNALDAPRSQQVRCSGRVDHRFRFRRRSARSPLGSCSVRLYSALFGSGLRDLAAVLLLDGAAHDHEPALRTGDATAHEDQVVLGDHAHDALVQDADGLVAVLTRHGLAREHATGGHVATDRAAVTLVLVSAVAVLRAGEVVAPHHAREAATAGDAL